MATREMSRRQKAFTLVPIALISGAWTVSMVGFGSADAAGRHSDGTLPDGTTVPSKAIQAPANVPVSGELAPGVPAGDADSIAAGASTSGIPSAALSAYQRAAQIIDAADTGCKIPWELIAAIGRVESDHGRYGGNVLGENGISRPGIYGPVLNGQDGTTAIKDTDGGELDQDATWDRAVGPMQFIPSTWQIVKVDADGDGQRNPQDINDAALATSVYLCSGNEDLSTTAGQTSAVYRYNHSDAYVDLVLRIMRAYSSGDYTAVPDGISNGQTFSYPVGGAAGTASKPPRAKLKKTRTTPKSNVAAPTTPSPTGSANGGSSSNNSSGGGSSSGGSTKAPVKVPTKATPDLPKAVSSAAAPVTSAAAAAVMSLAEATTYCRDHLGAASGVPNAVPSCASQLVGKTTSAASGLIGGIIAALLKNPLG